MPLLKRMREHASPKSTEGKEAKPKLLTVTERACLWPNYAICACSKYHATADPTPLGQQILTGSAKPPVDWCPAEAASHRKIHVADIKSNLQEGVYGKSYLDSAQYWSDSQCFACAAVRHSRFMPFDQVSFQTGKTSDFDDKFGSVFFDHQNQVHLRLENEVLPLHCVTEWVSACRRKDEHLEKLLF
jgi:hypothetical protein